MNKVNIKVSKEMHQQIVKISLETGINIYKLTELGLQKIVEDYESGKFGELVKERAKIRRDGSIVRS